jgi:hypothetical protein
MNSHGRVALVGETRILAFGQVAFGIRISAIGSFVRED